MAIISSLRCRRARRPVSFVGPRQFDRITVHRGCEVKNLDFTADGRGATLAW
jgi:hypothetical protein